MKQFRRRRIGDSETSLASQLMGLSLFIMLLAFFIVLNAISSDQQKKSTRVLNSLASTFGVEFDGADMQPSTVPEEEEAQGKGDALDQMEALFRAQITGVEAFQDKGRGFMHIRMPLERFSAAVMALGQGSLKDGGNGAGGGFFLPTLVSLMKSSEAGHPYRMDIIYNLPRNPALMQNDDPRQVTAATERLTGFARQLGETGLPPRLLSIGLHKAAEEKDVGAIDLFFRVHTPFSPVEGAEAAAETGNAGAGEKAKTEAAPQGESAPTTQEGKTP